LLHLSHLALQLKAKQAYKKASELSLATPWLWCIGPERSTDAWAGAALSFQRKSNCTWALHTHGLSVAGHTHSTLAPYRK